jgi:hypothetical protein
MLYYNRAYQENRVYQENRSNQTNKPYGAYYQENRSNQENRYNQENRSYEENNNTEIIRQIKRREIVDKEIVDNGRSNRLDYNIEYIKSILFPSNLSEIMQRILIVLYVILILVLLK